MTNGSTIKKHKFKLRQHNCVYVSASIPKMILSVYATTPQSHAFTDLSTAGLYNGCWNYASAAETFEFTAQTWQNGISSNTANTFSIRILENYR